MAGEGGSAFNYTLGARFNDLEKIRIELAAQQMHVAVAEFQRACVLAVLEGASGPRAYLEGYRVGWVTGYQEFHKAMDALRMATVAKVMDEKATLGG